ncbi:hypothetical protein V2G26_014210 [Clonostachys chloroleuca]
MAAQPRRRWTPCALGASSLLAGGQQASSSETAPKQPPKPTPRQQLNPPGVHPFLSMHGSKGIEASNFCSSDTLASALLGQTILLAIIAAIASQSSAHPSA